MKRDDVHENVAKAYTSALEAAEKGGGGCCGQSPCSTPAAAAARTAGYGDAETEEFQAAASASFGCGNPLAFAGVAAGETVLDLGSGAGLDLLIAARIVGETGRVIGIDMTDAMIEAARRNAAEAGLSQVEVRKGRIEALPVEDASVDWLISNCVINLSPDKQAVFSEMSRVLRPGGRFRISDIVVEELPASIREHAAAYAACIGGAIPEGEYLAGLRAAGLTDVAVVDRLVYDADQIRSMVAGDLRSHGLDAWLLDEGIEQAAGKVWSATVVGRMPE